MAALLVAVPILAAVWDSLLRPSLHGVTDRLIAVALMAAWASGNLITAAVLPIIMILGHVLEGRSLLGSREAFQALTRLTETTNGQTSSVSLPGGNDNTGTTISQFFGFYGGGFSALTISTADPNGLGFGNFVDVPEPASAAVLLVGLVGVARTRRRMSVA